MARCEWVLPSSKQDMGLISRDPAHQVGKIPGDVLRIASKADPVAENLLAWPAALTTKWGGSANNSEEEAEGRPAAEVQTTPQQCGIRNKDVPVYLLLS